MLGVEITYINHAPHPKNQKHKTGPFVLNSRSSLCVLNKAHHQELFAKWFSHFVVCLLTFGTVSSTPKAVLNLDDVVYLFFFPFVVCVLGV